MVEVDGLLEMTDSALMNPGTAEGHSSNTNHGTLTVGSFKYAGNFSNAGTMTVKDGLITSSQPINEGGVFNSGKLELGSDKPKIDGHLRMSGGKVTGLNGSAFELLEVSGRLYTSSNTLSVINGNLLTHGSNTSGNLEIKGDWLDAGSSNQYSLLGGNIRAKSFTSNRTVKVGTNTDGTLTVESVTTPNRLRVGTANSKLVATKSVQAGSLFNMGTIEAPNAVITLDGNEAVGNLTFVNGSDKDLDQDLTGASAVIGTLIVHGSVKNWGTEQKQSVLEVTNMSVDGAIFNEDLVKSEGGKIEAGSVDSEQGTFELRNATLAATGSSKFGAVKANNSRIEVGAGEYAFTSLEGQDKTLVYTDLKNTKSVNVEKLDGAVDLVATGSSNDQFSNANEALEAAAKAFTAKDGEGNGVETTVTVEDGIINDSASAVIGLDGSLKDVVITKNASLSALGSISTLSLIQWRHDMNDLTKRMGELRDCSAGVGSWARVYGSEYEYGAQNITAKNNSVQVGTDVDAGAWKIGAAFSYTKTDASYAAGDADGDAWGLGIYGIWLADDGRFVDLIAKYGRMSTDFEVSGMKGDYDNNAYSVSAEAGWNIAVAENLFVEPQIEATYGTVVGSDFTAKVADQSVMFEQDDVKSFITRAGLRAGFRFPDNKGTIYARASILHDFEGEVSSTAHLNGTSNTVTNDLGDTWAEFGIGASFRLSDRASFYADLERTNGAEVNEEWRWNIGGRYVW